MNKERLQPGAKLKVFIPKENREWGYNPCPDGTEVTFLRYSEIDYPRNRNYGKPPGIYENTCWAYVRDAQGKEWCELTTRFEPKQSILIDGLRLRDLPETEFYEGDVVTCEEIERRYADCEIVISHVRYEYIGQKRDDGSPMPLYSISDAKGGWYTSLRDESKMKLVRRGNYWKHDHGEPLTFKDISEEASFFKSIGQSTEVKSPVSGNYSWHIDDALKALKDGTGHAIAVDHGLFGASPTTRVWVFSDVELGKRVAAHTLEGFKDRVGV